jgi:hypothetical protein
VKDLIDLLISNSTQEYISDESEKLTSQPQSLTVGSLTVPTTTASYPRNTAPDMTWMIHYFII